MIPFSESCRTFNSGCFYLSMKLESESSFPNCNIQCVHCSLYSVNFERTTDSAYVLLKYITVTRLKLLKIKIDFEF